jgi:ABC-2 type transport system ATP-binding protein
MLYPELTVRRYLTFVAGVKGLGGAARRQAVDDAIDRCALGEVAGRHTGKLSKGFRQRVGLAQALLGDPQVLVLDEPTVGLDPVQTVELRTLIRSLSGCTVLLSTHILQEASALCTRLVILSRGRLVAEDSPATLAQRLEAVGRLIVRVEGPLEEVTAALAALPHVTGVEVEPSEGRIGHVLGVRTNDPEAVQRALAAAIVSRGWTLLEVRSATPSLEDLFVRSVQ